MKINKLPPLIAASDPVKLCPATPISSGAHNKLGTYSRISSDQTNLRHTFQTIEPLSATGVQESDRCLKCEIQTQLENVGYSQYKHCLVWVGHPNDEKEIESREAQNLMRRNGAWMLRNTYDFDCVKPTNFWQIIQDKHHEISELPSKVRNQVRRCLKDCDIRILDKKEMIEFDAYEVYLRAFERYHDVTVTILPREEWEDGIKNNERSEYWGVFSKESGTLIAWAANTIVGDSVNYNTLKAIPSLMNKHYPYYGLLYVMGQYYLEEMKLRFVSDGFRSVSEHSNIQPFLEKNFLFRKAYCKLSLHYRWWLKLAINVAYPFRNIIPNAAVKNILRFEEINRGKK